MGHGARIANCGCVTLNPGFLSHNGDDVAKPSSPLQAAPTGGCGLSTHWCMEGGLGDTCMSPISLSPDWPGSSVVSQTGEMEMREMV